MESLRTRGSSRIPCLAWPRKRLGSHRDVTCILLAVTINMSNMMVFTKSFSRSNLLRIVPGPKQECNATSRCALRRMLEIVEISQKEHEYYNRMRKHNSTVHFFREYELQSFAVVLGLFAWEREHKLELLTDFFWSWAKSKPRGNQRMDEF